MAKDSKHHFLFGLFFTALSCFVHTVCAVTPQKKSCHMYALIKIMYRRFFDVSRGSAEKETQEAYFQKSMLATFLGLLAE